jgi:chitin-binding protein
MESAPNPRFGRVLRLLVVIGLVVVAAVSAAGVLLLRSPGKSAEAHTPRTASVAEQANEPAGRPAPADQQSAAPSGAPSPGPSGTTGSGPGAPPAAPPAPAGWTLVWSPQAAKDGLGAFEGVEDDRAHSDPGRTHIYVEGDHYRVDMNMAIRDSSPDRQRNEVKGMRAGGKILEMNKGETWRLTYSMFIPSSLQATTSFTHIMQLKMPGDGSAPILTTSLRQKGNRPTIELNLFGQALVGDTDLAPLQNKWITSTIEFKIGDKPDGYVAWTLTSGGATVLDVKKTGADTFLADRVRPKWGIYRSLSDKAHLQDTYLLLTNMQAFKQS